MKKRKKRIKRYKKRGLWFSILRLIFLIAISPVYIIYIIIKTIHTVIGKAFLNLPRLTKLSIVYSLIFCAGFGIYVPYTNNPMVNYEVKTMQKQIDLPKSKLKSIKLASGKTKPKPKPKPKPKIVEKQNTYVQPQIITASANDYQRYAHDLCINTYGWTENDFTNLVKLWNRESGWRPNAHNPSSGAHGIPQSLPASKMASEGADYYTNGYTQIRWGLKYIAGRYGNPSNAWAHSEQTGWY